MELVYLGLAPAARGRGLGGCLMRLAEARSAAAKASHLSLAVDALNAPALSLYSPPRHAADRQQAGADAGRDGWPVTRGGAAARRPAAPAVTAGRPAYPPPVHTADNSVGGLGSNLFCARVPVAPPMVASVCTAKPIKLGLSALARRTTLL